MTADAIQAREQAVVTITPALPHAQIEHAGGKYLNFLFDALTPSALTVLAPPLPSVLRAVTLPGHPPRTRIARVLPGWLESLEMRLRRLDPGMPPWSLVAALLTDTEFAEDLRSARVVDLQWQESIRLLPFVRRRAPRARIVGTFHDVQSQKFDRLAQSAHGLRRVKWRLAGAIARASESQAMRLLDEAVVFSDKDAALLPKGCPVTVVAPPLASTTLPDHDGPRPRHVVFVAFLARPENHEAAVWLVRDMWPRVLSALPDATLDIVGAGATQELVCLADRATRVRLTGFVDDLEGVMAQAAVAAVPLREGAGVKFKTIEALLAGVPVVTTAVGAEGIEPAELFWRVTDDTERFAAGIVSALTDSAEAQRVADKAQTAVADRYGTDTFGRVVRSLYLS